MAQWRKVIVSGSSAVLNEISASGAIVPKADNGSDLGSSTLEWKNLYIDGTANIDSLVLDSGATVTAVLDQDNMSGDSATSLSTQQSIKAYVDSKVTDQDLDFTTTTGAGAVDLDSQALAFTPGEGINITHSGQAVTIAGEAASITNAGIVEIATATETNTGTDASRAVSPDALEDWEGSAQVITLGTIGSGTWEGATVAVDQGGTGATTLTDLITLTTHTQGNYVAAVTVGTGLGGAVASEGGTSAMTLDAAQTVITSLLATNIKIGEDNQTKIDFETADTINFYAGNEKQLILTNGALTPGSDNILDLGASDNEFKNAYFDGTVTSDAFVGPLTGEVAGNASTATALAATGNIAMTGDVAWNVDFSGTNATAGATIQAGAVENSMLADDAVNSDEIADGAVDNVHLANSAVTITAGDGLKTGGSVSLGGSVTLDFDASDIADTGIEANGENLRLATQGTGISGGAGSTLSITPAQTTITSVKNNSLVVGRVSPDDTINFGSGNVTIEIGGSEKFGVTSAGVDVTGNLTISGDLDVNGTVTTIDTANSYIADKFMIIASGSASDTDGGIIVQNSPGAGYALGYDQGTDRWALDASLAHNATDLVPDAYVGVVQYDTTAGDSYNAPLYGGATGHGTIYVDTNENEIWIYA